MKDVLDEIAIVPGVLGSCLYNKKNGQLCPGLPPSFTDDQVKIIANRATRLFEMGAMVDMPAQALTLWYNAYIIMATLVEKETLLLTVCESRTKCSLVSTTISLLTKELTYKLAWMFSEEQSHLTLSNPVHLTHKSQ